MKAGESFGEVESVKAVSDLYSPRRRARSSKSTGRLPDQLEQLNDDPYGAGWIVKIKLNDESELSQLLTTPPTRSSAPRKDISHCGVLDSRYGDDACEAPIVRARTLPPLR